MRALRIEIAGFKGAAPVAYEFTSPLVFITGRNGQGKSRIREALDFVLGRDVAGVSGSGKELRAALAGAELDVTLTLELDDGAVQTVRRSRRVEKGTFKKPVVYIGGVEADDVKLANLLGDVSSPAATSWLDLSEDKLLAEYAKQFLKSKVK
jgi:chromosome segregation ATPase